MADDFPVDTAEVVALFLETLFFGVYLVTFGMVMNVLLKKCMKQGRTGQRLALLLVALALFVVATLDEAILLRHVLEAFIWYHGSGGAIADFSSISYWESVVKTATYDVQTSIADAMLIYRCHIIYGKSWWIVVALGIIWMAGLAAEIYGVFLEATFHSNGLLSTNSLEPWLTATIAISLALNLIATTFITVRLFQIQRRNATLFLTDGYGNRSGSNLTRAMWIIIESGAMYSISLVVLLAVYLANNNALYGVSDAVVQIIGISFNLIIIRISQGQTVEGINLSHTLAATPTHKSRSESWQLPGGHHHNRRGVRRDGLSYADDIRTANLTTGTGTEGAIVVQFTQETTTDQQWPMIKSTHNPDDIELTDFESRNQLEKV